MDGASGIPLRPPGEVMRLARMGCFHATRLSFLRQMLRRLGQEGWTADRPVWEIDDAGVGHAVYRVRGPERTYSLVAFSHDLPDHLRSDRVIAEAWDSTYALYDGEPDVREIARLARNVPLQEAGRMTGRELTLSRANRSVRLFKTVIAALASGRQPAAADLSRVGYLMRTTAVYGSAKFGLADREAIADRPEMAGPFQAEMLTVWLIRAFTVDLVEHLARAEGGDSAVRLDRDLRRRLGVGNATGLGMAPFLINHPALIHHWIAARETALARVRAEPVTQAALARFGTLLDRVSEHVANWHTDHPRQLARIGDLAWDLEALTARVQDEPPDGDDGWEILWQWGADRLTLEGQEMLVTLLLEPHADLIDDLATTMATDEEAAFSLDGGRTVGALRQAIAVHYGWALECDWSEADAVARLWYTSAEKLEPRLAERAAEPLEPYEQPLAPARDVTALATDLAGWPADASVADFAAEHPEHRHVLRRVNIVSSLPYAEIRDNTIAGGMMPIDLLRAKLSFFGATGFDPRSDRWVRITLFQGAPFPDEPDEWAHDDWMWRT